MRFHRLARFLFALIPALSAAIFPSSAANINLNVSGGDWSTGANWSGGVAPTGGDNAEVNQGRSVTITTNLGSSGTRVATIDAGGNQNGALAGNGTITHNSGDIYSDWTRAGRGGNTGTFNQNGGLWNANQFFIGGENDYGLGSMNMNGGTLQVNSNFHVGQTQVANTSRGTFNFANGTITSTPALMVGNRASSGTAHGTFLQTGGSLTAASLQVGVNAQGFGTYAASAGSINLTTGGGQLYVGRAGGAGTMSVGPGVTVNANNSNFFVGTGGAGSTGVFNMTGGTVNNGYNTAGGTFRVAYDNGLGTFNMSGGDLNLREVTMGNNAGDKGYFNHSGGNVRVNGTSAWLSIGSSNSGQATWTATGGTLTSGPTIELGFRTGTTGVLTVAGTANYAATGLNMSGGNAGLATLSRFNLEGGTFRADTITVAHTATEFNWGSGVLALNTTSGTLGGTDLSLGTANSAFVAHGRQLTFQQGGYGGTGANETIATGSGINASGIHSAGGNSVLNLGGLYLSAGVRYNKAVFNDGMSLDATAAGDTLMMDTPGVSDTVYLLRPFGFFTEDYGSLPLIQFNGGGSMTGTFDTFIGLADDGKGFAMSTFAVTTATANTLAVNTWYLEQTASGAFFHYKVAGSVPEPGTFSLSLLGVWIARSLRRRSSSSGVPGENIPGGTVKMVRVRQARDPLGGRVDHF